MQKLHSIILSYMLLSIHPQLQAEYWKEVSWYATCYEVLFGPSIENIIPNLMMQHDQITVANPMHLNQKSSACTHICYNNKEFCIQDISYPITSGITYQTFQQILQSMPMLTNYNLEIRYNTEDIIVCPMAVGPYILLHTQYHTIPDATKLFILHHELQHHVYNDVACNHLIKIINLVQDKQIQEQLARHQLTLQNHIRRYIEYRSDSKALAAINCPYCLQEIATTIGNCTQKYNPHGYLYAWQFQSRIDQLITEKKCCQHHHNTGKQIDLSIIDESSLLDRLIIL